MNMKRTFLLILISIISLSSFGQKPLRDNVKVKTDIFEIMYSEKLEQPLWVKYTVQCPNGLSLIHI